MKSQTRIRTLTLLSVLSFAILPPHNLRADAAAKTKTDEPTYTLPEYQVTARRILPEPEDWRYTITPQFEILSNASDSITQKLYRDIGEYVNVLNSIAPNMRLQTASRVKLIICGQRGSFSQITGASGAPVIAGQSGEQIAFVINVAGDFMIPLNSGSTDADDRMAYIENRVYKNYIDLCLQRISPRLPPWMEHAMRVLFVDMKLNGNQVSLGEIRDGVWANISPRSTIVTTSGTLPHALDEDLIDDAANFSETAPVDPGEATRDISSSDYRAGSGPFDPSYGSDAGNSGADGASGVALGADGQPLLRTATNGAVRRPAIMRMQQLFSFDPAKPPADLPRTFNVNSWTRQSTVFVHYWLFRRTSTPKDKKTFLQFVEHASRESITEDYFKKCFGLSYKSMEMDLLGYLEYTDHNWQSFTFRDDLRPEPLELHDATPAQIARMKGETMVSFGKPAEGYHELLAPYIRKVGDPDLHASLGLYEFARTNTAKARALLEIAVKDHTTRSSAYRALAQLRLEEINASKPGIDAPLTSEQLDHVITPLMTAHTLPPRNVETYIMIADTLLMTEIKPTKEQAAAILVGVNRFPNNPTLTILAANVLMRAEYDEPARKLIARGLKQPGQTEGALTWLKNADAELNPIAPPAPEIK